MPTEATTSKPKRRSKRKSRSPRRTEGTHPTTTQPIVAKRIRVFRNGDAFRKPLLFERFNDAAAESARVLDKGVNVSRRHAAAQCACRSGSAQCK